MHIHIHRCTHTYTHTASSESDRLNVLETNMPKLTEIKNLLNKSAKPVGIQTKFDNNIWFKKDKLVSTKVAPAESILVGNKSQRLNNDSVEKAIVDNAIPVTKSYNNTSADLVIGNCLRHTRLQR